METLETIKLILGIISAVAALLIGTIIPLIVKFVKKCKEAKAAETEAEKQAAINDLLGIAHQLVAAAEETYKSVDSILKGQGGKGSGAVKKDSVMTKLQAACLEKGVEFDSEYWSTKVDEIVALTKEVNAQKGA